MTGLRRKNKNPTPNVAYFDRLSRTVGNFRKHKKHIDAYKITTNGPNDFKFGMVVLCMDIKLFVEKKFKESFYFRISFFKVGPISENGNLALLAPITS